MCMNPGGESKETSDMLHYTMSSKLDITVSCELQDSTDDLFLAKFTFAQTRHKSNHATLQLSDWT